MFTKTVIISLIGILCLSIGGYDSVFITFGDYGKEWLNLGLNNENCGLSYKPVEHNINHRIACFSKQYRNETRKIVYQFPPFETANTEPSPRIMGSRVSLVEDSPWTVKLFIIYNDPSGNKIRIDCTGVLVTFDWVLTAATCIPQNEGNINRIEVKADNSRGIVVWHPLNQFQIFHHKDYDHNDRDSIESRRHNLGLIKLPPTTGSIIQFQVQQDIFYTVNTICLPWLQDQTVLNEHEELATLSGWGHINTNEEVTKLRLKQITLKPAKECVRDQMLCGAPGKGVSCTYDMGGPLVQYSVGQDFRRAVLVGILQNNTPAADCTGKQTDVFVPLTTKAHLEWIRKTIEDEKNGISQQYVG